MHFLDLNAFEKALRVEDLVGCVFTVVEWLVGGYGGCGESVVSQYYCRQPKYYSTLSAVGKSTR